MASVVVTHPVRPRPSGDFVDTEITVWRSCGHWYYANYEPEIGSRCNLPCMGPQVETKPSGSVGPPLKKGKRWKRLPESKERKEVA